MSLHKKATENIESRRDNICGDCGAAAAGGRHGCQKLFDEVIAREFSDYKYGRLHRLTVDAYSLQHPELYMRSGKSFVAHLTGMCAALEHDDDTYAVNQAVQRWLNGPRVVERPEPPLPLKRGDLTIAYLDGAANPEEHLKRVREWARTTWNAWAAYHDLARQWIDRAITENPTR